MVSKRINKIVLIFTALALLTGCGNSDSTIDDKNANLVAVEKTATNTERIDNNLPEIIAYKKLISDALQKPDNSDLGVAVINLNDDDIYELAIFDGDAHNQGAHLYTYKDGQVILLNNDAFPFYGQYGSFSYNPQKKKVFYDYDSSNSLSSFYFSFEYERENIKLDYSLRHEIIYDSIDNVDDHLYYVNDHAVSRKEYNQVSDDLYSDFFNSDTVHLYYGDSFKVDTIEDIEAALSTSYPIAKDYLAKDKESESNDDIFDRIIDKKYDSYQNAYETVINYELTNSSEDQEYNFVYIDDDNIPELIVGKNGYYLSVYTFSNGYLSLALPFSAYGVGGCVEYEYAPYKNCIRSFGHGEETYGYTLYELEEGKIIESFETSSFYGADEVKYTNYTGEHLSYTDIKKIYDDTCYSYEFWPMGGGYSSADALEILRE